MTPRDHTHPALMSLDAAASAARSGFACMFSSSDEYETALITERRAQGRYGHRRRHWPVAAFVGCTAAMAAVVLIVALT